MRSGITTTDDMMATQRQYSLDSAFSSLSPVSSTRTMTSSFPSYGFITSAEVFTTSPKFNPHHHHKHEAAGVHLLHTPLLTHLDPYHTGFVTSQFLIDYWKDLGVDDGIQVLQDLGLDEERIDLKIVSEKLNDEIWHGVEVLSYPSAQAAIATLYDEVLKVKNTCENVEKERDKFRYDIREAQKRAEILAMEIDEQHNQRENQKREELQELNQLWYMKLKSIEDELEKEKESHEDTVLCLKRTFDQDKENFEEMIKRMERETCILNKRNNSLEEEIESTKERIEEIKEANKLLQKSLEKSINGVEHIHEIDTSPDLIKNVEDLVRLNKDLKDRNEVLEMDSLVNSFNACTHLPQENTMKRKGWHLQESPPYSKSKVIKKNTDRESESDSDEEEIISLSDIWCTFDQQFKEPSISKTLKDEMEKVQVYHTDVRGEQLIQKYVTRINELEERNKELQKTVSFPEIDQKCQDGQVQNKKYSEVVTEVQSGSCMQDKDAESESNMLLETNKHLEESLELMRTEFDSMEDYWQKKIEDERVFYEEQLKISENQFKELEVRMKEYEELLASMEHPETDKLQQLYPIDEQREKEESVNEWEEEIIQLKLEMEDLRVEHAEELVALKEEMDKIIKSNSSELNNASCIRCADFASLKEKRRNLEMSWLRVVDQDNKLTSSTGHLSLPAYLSEDDDRRQDLRQFIQEDYDNMLLRKERLKMFLTESKNDNSPCNVGTQAPQQLDIQQTSTPTAYKAILSDISYQVNLLQTELSTVTTPDKLLTQSLADQDSRCTNLHSTLASRRAQYSKDITVTRQQQIAEISQLESLVSSSQDLMRKQTRLYMEKMDKLVMMDKDVEQMMTENKTLASKIKMMKKQL